MNLFPNLSSWLQWKLHKLHAYRRLIRRPAIVRDIAAAIAMQSLNWHVHHGGNPRPIYALKTQLIRHFYRRGYCLETVIQKQVLHCRRCADGSITVPDEDRTLNISLSLRPEPRTLSREPIGEPIGEPVEPVEPVEPAERSKASKPKRRYKLVPCPRCHGTLIYRTHLLYKFTFIIFSIPFVWHQPQHMVNWPVTLTSPEPARPEPMGEPVEPVAGDYELYRPEEPIPGSKFNRKAKASLIALVCAYLELSRVKPAFDRSLRHDLIADLDDLRHRLSRTLSRWVTRRVNRWVSRWVSPSNPNPSNGNPFVKFVQFVAKKLTP